MGYLPEAEPGPSFPAFATFLENFGFVPAAFRAQSLLPHLVEAEAGLLAPVLFSEQGLTRIQKERIGLAVAAANANVYWVTAHHQMLRLLGLPEPQLDQTVLDHSQAGLPATDTAVLDFSLKLTQHPAKVGAHDIALLRREGCSDEQILAAVTMTAFAGFLQIVQRGLGAAPDFPPRAIFQRAIAEKEHLLAGEHRHTDETVVVDPDAERLGRVRAGDLHAFEELINLHSQRVYRTLVGILGDPEEARDAMQDTFLKVFQHLADFQGRSKFSTWLVTIASNTGLQRLRERKGMESLDDDGSQSDEGFRPRQVRAWTDNPEQLYAKAEMRALVESNVMRLPAKYRVVLVLRDMEQISTEEAAAALGLGIPALKARLLRGRLMLREALAAHFSGAMGVTS